jgi:glucose/mannose transport system substrate-binding protein
VNHRVLYAGLAVVALVASACGGGATAKPSGAASAAPSAAASAAPSAAPSSAATGDVEVFSWWTGGGEAAGLEAMIKVFNAKYPGINFVNAAVAGGAGTNARAVLATRLQANQPPDSFQGHAGQELIGTYVAAGSIEPLNDLFKEIGLTDKLPKTLIPLISKDGNPYSVPVNIHRANVLWYNPKVLKDAGVQPPTTWDEFFAAADKLKAAGVIPLAMGEQWTAMHLFETVVLGTLGAEKYNALWLPGADWSSAEVTAALDTYKKVLSYTNDDATSLTWQDASKLVADGKAAMNIMGDWADGYFSGTKEGGNLALTPGEGYAWAPVPGTKGAFQFLSDSFTLPKGAPHADNAKAWLTVAGSKEGQEAFNPVKGSICARTDCDPNLFNAYLKTAIADWAADTIVGSLTHGVVAADPYKAKINDAIGLFLADKDIAAFQKALVDGYATAGPK